MNTITNCCKCGDPFPISTPESLCPKCRKELTKDAVNKLKSESLSNIIKHGNTTGDII